MIRGIGYKKTKTVIIF